MKIIRKGNESKVWRGECHLCHAKVEAEEHEMTHITRDFREGGRFSWEKCPECGKGCEQIAWGGVCFYEVDR